MSDENATVERAKELLVYGPVGLALFLRDSAPQFMRMFVARGRTELDQRRKSVGEQIDQVRTLGETAATDGGPEVLRVLSTGLAALREKAEEALVALGVTDAGTSDAADVAECADRDAAGAVTRNRDRGDLAIPGYDDLSASQVVDHLDDLSSTDLEAIREYEAAHRARNTILGKIEQLTRGS
ncbi:MAG: hypothetical protein WD598_15120 [Acidimicrobiia bacterium]